jgi:hypothetical protein
MDGRDADSAFGRTQNNAACLGPRRTEVCEERAGSKRV